MDRRVVSSVVLVALACVALPGCARTMYDPDRATRGYPHDLHQPKSVDIQVFREGATLEIVNSTPHSYRDFDLWINQRYVRHVDLLAAGETLRLSLWDFYDVRGDRFSAGGFWRTAPAKPLRLTEIQVDEDQPLIGLVTITEKE